MPRARDEHSTGDAVASGCRAFDPLIAALGTPAISADDEIRARAHLLECARCRDLARLFDSEALDTSTASRDIPSVEGALASGAMVAGRYRLRRLLGGGGMGVVWSATQSITGQPVAIKLLRGEGASERSRRRLVREARAASSVQHPNVVRILDVVELDDGAPAIVMELLLGHTLQHLFDEGPMPLPRLCHILGRVAAAIDAAHGAGLIHRDLKPDNVFLARAADGSFEVKLLDFGIAKRTMLDDGAASATLTRTGALVGTPFYMSPEQVLGEDDVDARTDLWALGLILYQGLSGVLPTRGNNLGQVIKAITLTPFDPLDRLRPGVPPDVAAISARLLAKDRANRPALDQVRAVLARHEAASIDGHAAPLDRPRGAWHRQFAVGWIIAALVVSTGLALALRTRSAPLVMPTCRADMVEVDGLGAQPFCIDRTEVSTGAYADCVRSGQCTPAGTSEASSRNPRFLGRPAECNYGVAGREDHPINCVSFPQATAFCKAVGKRLPTVHEWRWAACMGAKSFLHPWGNEPPAKDQICWQTFETCRVGSHPAGATATGIQDLVGNVWEMTSTRAGDANAHACCGGGLYEDAPDDVLSERCSDAWDDEQFHDRGFRCAK